MTCDSSAKRSDSSRLVGLSSGAGERLFDDFGVRIPLSRATSGSAAGIFVEEERRVGRQDDSTGEEGPLRERFGVRIGVVVLVFAISSAVGPVSSLESDSLKPRLAVEGEGPPRT
jgi:hypothetical protein